ncbi:Vacuolar protein-sorting-associated protein 24 [Massospora cicadina]|nr:Vacuolar protein-sorting-associated protein 24 [Massospora cicadina]
MHLFRQPTPDELFRKWRASIRGQERTLDRQIRAVEAEERKVTHAVKQVAKRKDAKSCRILATEIVRARRHKGRLYTSKAQLNPVMMQLQHQTGTLHRSHPKAKRGGVWVWNANSKFSKGKLWWGNLDGSLPDLYDPSALAKMAGTLQKSAEVMKLVNRLVKLPEISHAMREMARELTKVGILEEMMEDTLEGLDSEGLEDEAEAEVNKVLYEITDGLFGDLQRVEEAPSKAAPQQPEVSVEEEDWERMQARLSALRS